MPLRVSSFNPAITARKLDNRRRGLHTALPDVLKRAGRLIAISLAFSTQPYGIDAGARKSGELATARDIRRVYATPGKVYVKFPNEAIARSFWATLSKGKISKAQAIMDANCPAFRGVRIAAFDGGAAHKEARNRRGRIPKTERFHMIVTSGTQLNAYIKREVDLVGFGKAGWSNTAKILGGTRGLGSSTKGSAQWVTRHKKAPASVIEAFSGPVQTVTLINQVSYVDRILDPAEKQEAVNIALDRMRKALLIEERRIARANSLA